MSSDSESDTSSEMEVTILRVCNICNVEKSSDEYESNYNRICKDCMKERKCNICEETKPIDMFGVQRKRKDGEILYRRRCKACHSKRQKKPEKSKGNKFVLFENDKMIVECILK